MFNISNKEKIIEFISKIYSWQKHDFNKVTFELKDYGFPLYFLSINDIFNNNDFEETSESIYLKDNIEKEIYHHLKSINFANITKDNIDLTLNLNPIIDEKTDFTLLTHNNELYCILNTNNYFTLYLIHSNQHKINLKLLINLKETLYNLSIKTLSSSS